jgi:hypothetical protein
MRSGARGVARRLTIRGSEFAETVSVAARCGLAS